MPVTAPRRLIVLGAGAIGASIGALLWEAGWPVTLVARGAHGAAIAERGLDLRYPSGARLIRVPVVEQVQTLNPGPEDLILLATMGQHSEAALAPVHPEVPVVSFQNGLAPLHLLQSRGHPALAAMVYVPAERRSPGVIVLSGAPVPGAVWVGAWPQGHHPWVLPLVQGLAQVGFRAEVEPDLAPWLRAKLMTNLVGVLGAVCDAPPAELVRAVQAEARAVWQAAGQDFREVSELMARVGPLQTLPVDGLPRVGGSTRGALSRGEPLETETLSRELIEAGRRLGVPTPLNEALVRLSQEAVQQGWAPGALTPQALMARLEK